MVFENFVNFVGDHARKIYQFAGPLFNARVELWRRGEF
jgi:hypothetical protein